MPRSHLKPPIPRNLRPLGRRLLRLPGLRALRPAVQRARAVADPSRRLALRTHPDRLARQDCHALTILSANLWHDWPRYRRLTERLEAFAHLVESEGVDVILIQELARTPDLRSDEWLAERLGMAYLYSQANGHERAIGFEEGLAVFSRFPIMAPQLKQWEAGLPPFVRRLALGATLQTPCGELLAFSVHLSLGPHRNAIQLQDLQQWIPSMAGTRTALIGGDFNAREESTRIASAQNHWVDIFRQAHPHGDGKTFTLRWPWGGHLWGRRLDYIFLHPGNHFWHVLEARHLETPGNPHSDHQAVLARIAPTH